MMVRQQISPPGRSVLITGAASGIGRAIALRLAGGGASLALLDRDEEALGTVAKEASTEGADAVLAHGADVSSRREVAQALTVVTDAFGRLDGLVCSAGILRPGGLSDVTDREWQQHLAVNAGGVLHCLQESAPLLTDGGAVVVVGSNAARVPRTGMLAYSASKAAASALTRAAGLELAERGIRCNVVEPGSTDTPMQRDLWDDADAGRRAALEGDPSAHRLGIPLGRLADPDDVAAMVCFLLSPEARHVTLQQIYVDGGASL